MKSNRAFMPISVLKIVREVVHYTWDESQGGGVGAIRARIEIPSDLAETE